MKHTPLAIFGTSSHAGKTTVTAGLCPAVCAPWTAGRAAQVAEHVAEFVCDGSGEEIARSTAVAGACGQADTDGGDESDPAEAESRRCKSADPPRQAVCGCDGGRVFRIGQLQSLKWQAIDAAIASLRRDYDLIVVEGAGGCAEPNLRALDVVNFGLAARLPPMFTS